MSISKKRIPVISDRRFIHLGLILAAFITFFFSKKTLNIHMIVMSCSSVLLCIFYLFCKLNGYSLYPTDDVNDVPKWVKFGYKSVAFFSGYFIVFGAVVIFNFY